MTSPKRPVLGTIAVVCHLIEGRPHVILIQRGKDPNKGAWGFPGGHVEWGETAEAGAARELREETSVIATPVDILTTLNVMRSNAAGEVVSHYLLTAVACDYVSGTPHPDDDAADARWVAVDDLAASDLGLLPQVIEVAKAAQTRLLSRIDSV